MYGKLVATPVGATYSMSGRGLTAAWGLVAVNGVLTQLFADGATTVIAICTCTARLMSQVQQVNRLCGKCCSSPTPRTPPRWRASTSSVHWNAAAATDVATGVGDQPQEMGRVRESASTADVQDLVENIPHG